MNLLCGSAGKPCERHPSMWTSILIIVTACIVINTSSIVAADASTTLGDGNQSKILHRAFSLGLGQSTGSEVNMCGGHTCGKVNVCGLL